MTSVGIEIVVPPAVTVQVTDQNSSVVVTQSTGPSVTVSNAPVQTNLFVSNTDPGLLSAGLWINTNADGLGGVTLNLVYDDGT